MDWPAVLAIGLISGGVVFVLTLAALAIGLAGMIRRQLDQSVSRHAQTMRQLAEALALTQRQVSDMRQQIQGLSQANRRLTDQMETLLEKLNENSGTTRQPNPPRLLH
jgi:methyl-accepting chemotaxis protein